MKKLFLLMAMALPVCLFTACGSDDDEDGGDAPGGSMSSSVTEIKGSDGSKMRLTSDGDCRYYYDKDGNLTKMTIGSETIEITNNPFRASSQISDNESYVITADFNSKGYFSKVKTTAIYKGEDWASTLNKELTFSYDNDGHLIKTVDNSKETGEEDGEKYSYSSTKTHTFTWKDGLLTSAESISKEMGDGENYTKTIEVSFSYDVIYPNVSRQYTHSHTNGIDGKDSYTTLFALIGFCGKGSAQLPSSYTTVKGSYGDGEGFGYIDYGNTFTCTYTYNENGTVKTEKCGNTYSYSYINTENAGTVASAKLPMAKAAKQASSLRPLFFTKRLNRNRQK